VVEIIYDEGFETELVDTLDYLEFFTNKQRIVFFLRKRSDSLIPVFSCHIQQYLGIGKSYASSLLSELEDLGYICRKARDNRKHLFLTEEGIKLTNFVLLSCLTDTELRKFNIK